MVHGCITGNRKVIMIRMRKHSLECKFQVGGRVYRLRVTVVGWGGWYRTMPFRMWAHDRLTLSYGCKLR